MNFSRNDFGPDDAATGEACPDGRAVPQVELSHLDDLWFQVGGTLCNLTCRHCFISCSPHNRTFGFVGIEDVRRRLAESVPLGVKEYYFTGGEPFLNPEMVDILVETLRYGPATVLTNATVLKDAWLQRLAAAEAESIYSLEFRVSIDGFSPETNDPIRGDGTFDRAVRGIERLAAYGFLPIITATRTWPEEEDHQVLAQFAQMLHARGVRRPRLKILPTLHIGAEAERSRGYGPDERLSEQLLEGFDTRKLVCEHSRIVTDRGVHVCPILIEAPDARLGDRLDETLGPYELKHGACFTCYQYGSICANPSGSVGGEG